MPTAPLRPCAGGCGVLVARGRCRRCAQALDQTRGTATQRGYDRAWARFRPRFLLQLVEAGQLPVCGAALPDGPQTTDSYCRRAGLLTYRSADESSLHFDHTPPLQAWERAHPAIVCDPLRIQLLCASCHAVKTSIEERAAIPANLRTAIVTV